MRSHGLRQLVDDNSVASCQHIIAGTTEYFHKMHNNGNFEQRQNFNPTFPVVLMMTK